MTSTIPEPLRGLLAAVAAALDVPLADHADDDPAAARLLRQRASDAAVIIRSVLKPEYSPDVEGATAQLLRWTAEHPVTYQSWQARTEGVPAENGGGGR